MTPDAAEVEEVNARFCRVFESLDLCRMAGGATRTLGGRFKPGLHQRRRVFRPRAPSDPP
jgi:hypothetical protein